MDGNGRWAKKRFLPRTAGHKVGLSRIRELIVFSNQIGIESLTLYALSTENRLRPSSEVSFLFASFISGIKREAPVFFSRNIKMNIIGERSTLPSSVVEVIDYAENLTKNCTGLVVNFAFNYGGRWDILEATRTIAREVAAGTYAPEEIDEKLFATHLSTKAHSDVDLLIRTSGEYRISNFLLWQISYAEIYFTDVLFPAFTRAEYVKALEYFSEKERRIGKISEQLNECL